MVINGSVFVDLDRNEIRRFRILSFHGLLREKLGDIRVEIGARVDRRDQAILIHEPHGRDLLNMEAGADLVVPDQAVEVLRPGHPFLRRDPEHGLFALVQGNAHDLETLVVIFLIGGHDVGHFFHARPAPRGPEVDQDHLAVQPREIDRRAIGRVEFQGERFAREVNGGCGRVAGFGWPSEKVALTISSLPLMARTSSVPPSGVPFRIGIFISPFDPGGIWT